MEVQPVGRLGAAGVRGTAGPWFAFLESLGLLGMSSILPVSSGATIELEHAAERVAACSTPP